MTTILHLSDTHICANDSLMCGRVDTNAALDRLVAHITESKAAFGAIDAVLVSGDVSEDGSAESYDQFKRALAPLELPVFVIPGNHDARETMRRAFVKDGYLSKTGPLNWHKQIGDVHLIGIDTLVEGEGGGRIDQHSLDFLGDTLASVRDVPVLLALHHPPFQTAIRFMDKIGLENRVALSDAVSDYAGSLLVVCGHIHCMMVSPFANHLAMSAPSPCSSFAFDTREDAPVGFMDLPDGCLLHRWDGGFRSVRINATRGQGPFPFTG